MSEMNSDQDEFDILFMYYCYKKRYKNNTKQKAKRLCWVHDINKKRKEYGEYHRLVKELELDNERFFDLMGRQEFEELLNLVGCDIQKQNTHLRESISAKQRLAVTLRFLATGNSYKSLGFSYRMSSSTIGQIVKEVCTVIWEKLQCTHLKFPQSAEQWETVAGEFKDLWNFPHCLGALDGKHISMKAPNKSGSLYFNYKGSFSVVLLALVDARYRFIMVDIGSYGKNSDGGIFSHSKFGKLLKQGKLELPSPQVLPNEQDIGPVPYVFVGDEAFPLMVNLMRPYPSGKKILTEEQRVFNYRLSRARRIVENAFGILAARWRVFHTKIALKPDNAVKVVQASCILHNFLQQKSCGVGVSNQIENSSEDACHNGLTNLSFLGTRGSEKAMAIRDDFKMYFSGNGKVPWQYEIVRKGALRVV